MSAIELGSFEFLLDFGSLEKSPVFKDFANKGDERIELFVRAVLMIHVFAPRLSCCFDSELFKSSLLNLIEFSSSSVSVRTSLSSSSFACRKTYRI